MESGAEQNKTEEATPYKLKRAREKGMVARGTDLGFFSTMAALTLFALAAATHAAAAFAEAARQTLALLPTVAQNPEAAIAAAGLLYGPSVHPVLLLGATAIVVVALFEIVQLRGIVFSGHPLKPDFNRLNPAKGLKRLFSVRMLKETAKNLVKMVVYIGATFILVREAFSTHAQGVHNTESLAQAMYADGTKLLFAFVLLSIAFALLDQVIARAEFGKQMRMSRRELTREYKEREGEPRLKQKRKQFHASLIKQARGFGAVRGSDLLIVNPDHYAVALFYEADRMGAPRVTAKGRNLFALMIKRLAARHAVAVFQDPPLARQIYRECQIGAEIPPESYKKVADLYLELRRQREAAAS